MQFRLNSGQTCSIALAGLAANENWQQDDTLHKLIQQANACGALATTAKGAMTALPTAK